MSDLGDLLVLLHDAALRCRTVQATGRTWRDADRARAAAARARAGEEGTEPSPATEPLGLSEVPDRVTAWRVRFERPDRIRLERDRAGGDFSAPVVVVVDDGTVRTLLRPGEPPSVVADRRRRPAPYPYPAPAPLTGPLFDPSTLLGAFRFTVTGRGDAAGRPAVAATAVRTGRIPANQAGLPRGADELELLVDAEFGVLLRLVCGAGGEAFEVQQVREIAFDQPIPPGTFDTAPPPPEPVAAVAAPAAEPAAAEPVAEPELVAEPVPTPAAEPAPAPPPAEPAPEPPAAVAEPAEQLQPVSLEEAVRKSGFPVLLPRQVPAGPKLRILLNPSATNPSVQLHYQFQAPTHHLSLDERPAGSAGSAEPPAVRFERRTHRGQELEVWEGPEGARAARVERAGVSVRLDTDLELDTLLDVATSLVPVRMTRSPGARRPPAPTPKP